MLREKADPFTTEIIRASLVATTDEMKTSLMRTAYNLAVYEALDFTVAVTDQQGNLVSIGLGLPSFIRGISDTVKAFVKFFGSDIHPGDVLLTNDSYTHGSHLNHMVMALPVFHDGEIVAFSCSEPHWIDIGGVMGGFTTDIYSEGLQIPYVKIYKRGELDKEIVAIIRANVRNPDLAMGDFRGQVACARTGEKRLLSIAKKYGADTLSTAIETIFDQSAEISRKAIREIPEGTYEAEQFMDDDGIDMGKHIPLGVKITVKGDSMTVDLSGVGKQVRGYYNSGAGVTGAQMGFKMLTSPLWRPVNDGSFRPLKVILPPGSVVSATRPAAMRMWMIIPTNIADTMWKAIAPAMPQKIAAGHHSNLGGGGALVIDPATGRPLLKRVSVAAWAVGGWGAKYNEDGMPATICLNDGDTHNNPVEAGEAHDPTAMVLRYELRQDSGGPGKFRGGVGCLSEIVYFWDALMNSYMERSLCLPWGLFGGKPGMPNVLHVATPKNKLSPEEASSIKVLSTNLKWEEYPNESHPNTKISNRVIPAGSRIITLQGGAGGYGNPREREIERVREDVVNGYVSVVAAEREYGVVINQVTNAVDSKRTGDLRRKIAGS